MTTIWTLAADGTHARIFQMHGMERNMEEIQDVVNPVGRAKDGELRDDAQERFAGKGEPMPRRWRDTIVQRTTGAGH
ncbi:MULTISPECIES: host attachment protein [Cupriavidus]|uniref:host attachment protein n=1 Tax=Cupriavidus TaxID=106589 RepID=UPI0002D85C3F|nr:MULTISPECIES: host attachment protein [Cupriavidus]QYY29538.1 host attachment protein [Cupriavidus pinatubonensis]